MEQSPFENLIITHPVKKFPSFYRTPKFITMFTRSHHCSLSWARCFQSTTSHPIYL